MATGVQVWSEVPVTNATADSNINWAEGMAPSQVNDSARALMASVAKWRDDNTGVLVTSGTSNALTVATNQVESALTTGFTVRATLGTAVAASATLAVDGLAATSIFTTLSTASLISTGSLNINQVCAFMFSTGVSTAGNSINGWIATAVSPTASGVPALTSVTANSSATTSFTTSSFTDSAVSAACGTTGVWHVTASVAVQTAGGAGQVIAKLYDGTSVINTGILTTPAAAFPAVMSLTGVITNPAGNLRLACRGNSGGGATYAMLGADINSLTTAAQNVTAFRIG